MQKFENLTLSEQVEAIYDACFRFSQAAQPIVQAFIDAANNFAKYLAQIMPDFTNDEEFMRRMLVSMKREKNRRNYQRMMRRRR